MMLQMMQREMTIRQSMPRPQPEKVEREQSRQEKPLTIPVPEAPTPPRTEESLRYGLNLPEKGEFDSDTNIEFTPSRTYEETLRDHSNPPVYIGVSEPVQHLNPPESLELEPDKRSPSLLKLSVAKEDDFLTGPRGTGCYFGYIRVSTSMQVDDGVSLEVQTRKIQAWGEMHESKLIKIYADEGISGRSMKKRAGLKKVLKILQPGETLVVYSFSRLSRSVKDFLSIVSFLSEKKCELAVVKEQFDTTTPHGRFTAIMFAGLAQLESDLTSERVKDAMAVKKENGEACGRPPYGWKSAGEKGSGFIMDAPEQFYIAKIKRLRDTGAKPGKKMSYAKIAEQLNDERVPPPGKSKKWYPTHIQRIYNRQPPRTKGRDTVFGVNGKPAVEKNSNK